jgi:hypothetical protein
MPVALGLLGLPGSDSDGMAGIGPQSFSNLAKTSGAIVDPEVPDEGNEPLQPPGDKAGKVQDSGTDPTIQCC